MDNTSYQERTKKQLAKKFKVKAKLAELDGLQCYYCETPLPFNQLTLDHIFPLSKFSKPYNHRGTKKRRYSAGNLVLACQSCNLKKGNRIISIEEFKKEIMGDNYRDPGELERVVKEKRRQAKLERRRLLREQRKLAGEPIRETRAEKKRKYVQYAKNVVYPEKVLIWSANSGTPPPKEFPSLQRKLTLWKKIKKVFHI